MINTKLLSFIFATAAVMLSVESAAMDPEFATSDCSDPTRQELRQLAITHMQQQAPAAPAPAAPAPAAQVPAPAGTNMKNINQFAGAHMQQHGDLPGQ